MRDGDVIDLIDGQSTHDPAAGHCPLYAYRRFRHLRSRFRWSGPLSPIRTKQPPRALALAAPALGEQFYENASILYLKPGVLTAARVDDIAARIKGAGKKKILLDLRDTTGDDPHQGLRLANFASVQKRGILLASLDQVRSIRCRHSAPILRSS